MKNAGDCEESVACVAASWVLHVYKSDSAAGTYPNRDVFVARCASARETDASAEIQQ